MAVGLPGTGIGGLFYGLLALFMPLRKLASRDRGVVESRRWPAIALQLGLVGGILLAMSATAWVVGALVRAVRPDASATGGALGRVGAHVPSVLTQATLLAGAISLAAVILLVQVLRLVFRRRETRATPDMLGAAMGQPGPRIVGATRRSASRALPRSRTTPV